MLTIFNAESKNKQPASQQTENYQILYKMLESLSAKIETKMSPHAPDTAETAVSPNFSKNYTPFPFVTLS